MPVSITAKNNAPYEVFDAETNELIDSHYTYRKAFETAFNYAEKNSKNAYISRVLLVTVDYEKPNFEQPITQAVKVTFKIPTSRVDGTPLSPDEIKEFRIYFAKNNGADSSFSQYLSYHDAENIFITGLDAGLYDFAVTTVDVNDLQSDFSNIVTVEVN